MLFYNIFKKNAIKIIRWYLTKYFYMGYYVYTIVIQAFLNNKAGRVTIFI